MRGRDLPSTNAVVKEGTILSLSLFLSLSLSLSLSLFLSLSCSFSLSLSLVDDHCLTLLLTLTIKDRIAGFSTRQDSYMGGT
jgi:hypothetical protein